MLEFEFTYRFIPIIFGLLVSVILFFINDRKGLYALMSISLVVVFISYTFLFYYEYKEFVFFFDVYDYNDLKYASKLLASEYFVHIIGLIIYHTLTLAIIFKKRFLLLDKEPN